ncbi:MAG: HIT family protein [Patescibacteria group bacterium]
MKDCIFCDIVDGKSPAYKIYEDNKFIGILDIFPAAKGHVLLIPKQHYRWVHDVPDFSKYWQLALKIKKALDKALSPKWTQYLTHGVIAHAHIHIIPRYEEIDAYWKNVIPKQGVLKFEKEEMEEIADKICKVLN